MECGFPKIKKEILKVCAGFFLFTLSACSGVGSVGGINAATGDSVGDVAQAQPFDSRRPSPGIDPTCREKANCLENGVFYFDEEKRVYTALSGGKLKTEISGYLFENRSEGPLPASAVKLLLVKETVNQICQIAKVGEGGAVQFPALTPTLLVPSFRYYIGRVGYDHAEGTFDCASVEGDFDLNHPLLDFIVWDGCFASLPAAGSPLSLSTPVDTPWTADYCAAMSRLASGTSSPFYSATLEGGFRLAGAFQRFHSTTSASNSDDSDDGTDSDEER